MAKIAADREKELRRVQRDIARRRRKRLLLLGARLLAFVTFPTFIATWYFYVIATPMYATNSEFVIQQADSQSGMGGSGRNVASAGGMGLGGQNEATSVQSFPAIARRHVAAGSRRRIQGPFQPARISIYCAAWM
jgi:capsular polysaccharide transport system permease protein